MRVVIKTWVARSPEEVWQGFDEALFRALAPPFPMIRVLRFEGCQVGQIVEAELNFVLFKQSWSSLITEQNTTKEEICFVDEGTRLPFFLKKWRHRHRIVRAGEGATIIDEVEYQTPMGFMNLLIYPAMWMQFAYRKPIYRRVFGR
jgi:ligand-binding SRPBCC domain-containing protein